MRYYDAKTGTMVEEVGDLTQRQWPSKELFRFNKSWNKPGHCACCDKPLTKWEGAYYGILSDSCNLYDYEYSFFTSYCEECAKNEAERTRKQSYTTCPPVVSHTDNIKDDGFACECKVYADGVVVESTASSIKDAQRWW